MNWQDLSRYLVTVASVVITIGLYDQAFKIWRTKSVKDFTMTLVFALVLNEFAWLNYGLAIKEWPIVIIGLLNIPAALIAFYGYFKFKIYN